MLRSNIAANYIGTAVNTVIPFLATPFYLNLLGDRAWGLVSTIFLIQSILYLSEAGISQISSVAFSRIKNGDKESAGVIKEYELIYWLIAIAIFLTVIISSSLFAWLDFFQKYSREELLTICFGGAFIFLAQFPGAVYKSVLMNAGQQIQFNKVSIIFTLVRHGITIVVLSVHSTLLIFLSTIISLTILETGVRRKMATQISDQAYFVITAKRLKQLYTESLGPAVTVIIGMLTTQLDKVLGAIILSPEEYGRYTLASILAQGCISVTQPIIQAMSPQILQHRAPSTERSIVSRKLFTYLVAINFVILFVYWVFGYGMIEFWLKSSAAAKNVKSYFDVLIWGAILNSIYHVNYFSLLAESRFVKIFWINIFGLGASATLTPYLINSYGTHWIGVAFFIPNFIAIVVTTFRKNSTR